MRSSLTCDIFILMKTVKNILNSLLAICLFTALSGCIDSPAAGDPSDENNTAPTGKTADHTVIHELWEGRIPEEDIQHAIDSLHIAYGHTSHGSQIPTGMDGLVDFSNAGNLETAYEEDLFQFNSTGAGGVLHFLDCYNTEPLLGDVGYHPAWVNETQDLLDNDAYNEYNVIMWSWCGQVSDRTEESMISTYLEPMSTFEEEYPNTVFIYMTGHLDGSGDTGNLHLRNEQIRAYCSENDKWLFDFADIESYDPEGRGYLSLDANDGCYWDSNGDNITNVSDRNWATEWQSSHTEDVDWYDCGAAHSESLNANMKAYAMWWLLSEIAKEF